MRDSRVQKMAEVIVRYSLAVQPAERLLIVTAAGGMPLGEEVYRQALHSGAHPYVRTSWSELERIMLQEGSEEQIVYVHPLEKSEAEEFETRLVIRAESNTMALASVDPQRIARQRASRQMLFNRILERKARGELRTCLTRFPTEAAAQAAAMSLAEYEEFVFKACLLDRPDPIAAWQEVSAVQQQYVDRLSGVSRLRIEGEGTELELSVRGRRWINSDGKANFPSGEVFTGPVEDSAEGRIHFDIPSVYSGRKVEGIALEFSSGRVVRAQAEKGDDLLQALLNTDGNSRLLGEVAFGLNYSISRATGEILFDEKIGGTVHLALGAGYPETLSRNRSSIHWDMIKDMRREGRVIADGRVIYEKGRFVA